MGGGGKSGGSNEAALARQEEQARQERIRQGTQTINDIFDGGYQVSGMVNPADIVAGQTYYKADGTPFVAPAPNSTPDAVDSVGGFLGIDRSGLANTGSLRLKGGSNNRGVNDGDEGGATGSLPSLYSQRSAKDGFNDDFYAGRRQAYIDYATPQLEDQYGDANRELTFALDRAGLLNSSVRGQKAGELQKMFDIQSQQVGDKALAYENQTRNDVERARSELIAMLNATGDTESATQSAAARAAALTQPGEFSPLSSLFADFTSGLGTQGALERANYYSGGAVAPTYNTGLFSPSKSSVRVR